MMSDHLCKHQRALPEPRLAALCCLALLAGCAQSEPVDHGVDNDVLELEIEPLTVWPDDDLPPIDEEFPDSVSDANMVVENRTDDEPGD
jgi:hypothetical protein